MGLWLGLLLWSIGLPVCSCTNTVVYLLLWLCSIGWCGVLWCLQYWTFCSELLWLLKVLCFHMYFQDCFFYFSAECHCNFDRNCIEHVDSFW
jgi:hypothetical protein